MTPSTSSGKKRNELLTLAIKLFNEQGYHDTRLEDIAELAGKSKTSVSYHFRSKESLLGEVYRESSRFADEELDIASREPDGLSQVLKLVRLRAEAHIDALSGRRPPLPVMSEIDSLSDIDNQSLKEHFSRQVAQICQFFDAGQRDGSIEVSSAEAATFFVVNILDWIPRWLSQMPNAHHGSALDGLCDLLLNGIVAEPEKLPKSVFFKPQMDEYPEIFDREVRNRIKRNAILRAGTRRLNRQGFRNLSLNDIAADLGVSRSAIYYYFPDKESLIEDCFNRTCNQIDQALEQYERLSNLTAIDEIRLILGELFEGHITNLDPLMRLTLLNALGPTQRVTIEARLKRISAHFAQVIARGMAEGSARPIEIGAFENLVMGSVLSASPWRLKRANLQSSWRPESDPARASDLYFEPLLKGIKSP